MLPVHPVPVFLALVVGLLLGLLVWGFWRARRQEENNFQEEQNDLFVGFLILAGFAVGGLLMYLLLGVRL
jgi:sensor domain CHASE-containing protein